MQNDELDIDVNEWNTQWMYVSVHYMANMNVIHQK